ncbi:MAG TPA: cyclic nucleotide-binding domain-containing protein, partial [Holophagaceae bacterium]|nr:cyclic nucleotide-binding domain-containing protein [Holophagaceae bacterium]
TDLVPNRVAAQCIVTNLYAPVGLHRRTALYTIQATARLHEVLAMLSVAMAGLPHFPDRRPKVVAHGQHDGGVELEIQVWSLGYRHAKASMDEAHRIVATVLAREGHPLMGPFGPGQTEPPMPPADEAQLDSVVELLNLPAHWARDLEGRVSLHRKAPGEGVIREGDAGDSLYAVLEGRLAVVHPERREAPYSGLFWNTVAEIGRGDWVGESSLLTGAPRNATVVAAEPTLLLEMDKAAFETSLKREPEVLERLADLMARRAASRPGAAEVKMEGFREQLAKQMRAWFGIA